MRLLGQVNQMEKPIVDLQIKSFTKKGNGLADYQTASGTKSKVEVPFTAPEDHVRVRLLGKRSGCYQSQLQEVVSPSPLRIAPRCLHFATCGGCRFQHISYEEQLRFKSHYIESCFQSVLTPQVDLRAIIPAPKTWQYRNKMEYSFSSDAAGNKYLGMIIDSSRGKVFHLTECHLTNSWFVDVLKAVRAWWHESGLQAYNMHRNTGSLRTLTVREGQRTGDRMIILTVSGNADYALNKQQLDSFIAYVRDIAEPLSPKSQMSIFLRIQQTQKGSPTQMYEMVLHGADHIREILRIRLNPIEAPRELTFQISPSAFFQPNTEQAEQLYNHALQIAKVSNNDVVYDLYCGTGSLGICLANHVKQVTGIELSPEAALDARTNATLNGCQNLQILSGDVGKVLRTFQEQQIPPPDLVMVDPPRAGLTESAIENIVKANPSKILYVSCNPATQAMNIGELVKHGYRLVIVQPIDQFPQTVHVENIAFLER